MQPTFSVGTLTSSVEVGNVCSHSDQVEVVSSKVSSVGYHASTSCSMSSDVLSC